MRKLPGWLLAIAVLLILVGAGASLRARVAVEEGNKSTGIVLEWSVVSDLASAQGISEGQALASLKQQGLTHVALSEDVGSELFGRGLVRFDPEQNLYLGNWRGLARITTALKVKYGQSRPVRQHFDRDSVLDGRGLALDTLQSLPLGLDPLAAQTVKKAGLGIVARLINAPGMTPKRIKRTLVSAHGYGANYYLPLGEQVLGFRDSINRTAEALEETGMMYATPEFSKIAGDAKLAEAAKRYVVRLHPIQSAEVDKLGPADFIERFVKASRERGMRLLLVRPINTSADKPIVRLGDDLKALTRALIKEGAVVGEPRPYSIPEVPAWSGLVIRIGIAIAAVWLAMAIAATPMAAIIGALLAVVTMLSPKFGALIGAMIFPVIGYVLWTRGCRWHPVARFFLLSFTSLVGGLCVSGLLNSLDTLLKIEVFSGVLAALMLPLVAIFLWLLVGRISLKELGQQPLKIGQLIMGLFGFVVLAFMAMRSGNDAPGGVSGLELKFRSLLEQFLIVRPRTKEFLLGHPALMIGLFLENRESERDQSLGALLLAVGAIGQTSIVNTLCHLHTPLIIGLTRIGVGLVLGALFGILGWAVIRGLATMKRTIAWRNES
ncbi:MAG: hypothetical protein JNJ45_10135 [Chthonomonas sp.]|nr:hypothetical protein [Chthonomonas sp.]